MTNKGKGTYSKVSASKSSRRKSSAKTQTVKKPKIQFEKGHNLKIEYLDKSDNPDIMIHTKKKDFDLLNDFHYDDELFWNDMIVHNEEGWQYIYDANTDTVYPLDDYNFNAFHELRTKGKVKLEGRANDEDYEDAIWNQE